MFEAGDNKGNPYVPASAIDGMLWHLACDNMTINDMRERCGLSREPIRLYDVKIHADGYERGRDAMRRTLAEAMYAVIRGDKTPNEALCDVGLAPINDPRAGKYLIPVPEPLVLRPDIYISKGGSRYEMVFHNGAFRGTSVEIRDDLTAEMMEEAIERAIMAYWEMDQAEKQVVPALIAYDPWSVTGNMLKALTSPTIGAVSMRPGDAAKALTNNK